MGTNVASSNIHQMVASYIGLNLLENPLFRDLYLAADGQLVTEGSCAAATAIAGFLDENIPLNQRMAQFSRAMRGTWTANALYRRAVWLIEKHRNEILIDEERGLVYHELGEATTPALYWELMRRGFAPGAIAYTEPSAREGEYILTVDGADDTLWHFPMLKNRKSYAFISSEQRDELIAKFKQSGYTTLSNTDYMPIF